MRTARIGPLACVIKDGSPKAPVIVLMHGYGADGHDLAPLADAIPAGDATWIFPEAPTVVPIGPHMTGRAWFPIDMRAIEEAMLRGGHRDFTTTVPPGMSEAAAQVNAMLAALGRDLGDVYLGGFSQGGMVACEVALHSAKSPKGLVMLSSTLVSADRWDKALAQHKGMPVLISHGRYDPVLSFKDAERLRDLMVRAGLTVEFMPFEGGHEIPAPVLRALSRFVGG